MSFDLSLYHAKQDESTSKEGSRHQHLRRKVRRPIENATRKGRTNGRGTGRTEWNPASNNVQLGICGKSSRNQPIAATGGRSWSYSAVFVAKRIIQKIFRKNLLKEILPIDNKIYYGRFASVASLVHGHLTIRHTWRPVSGGTTQH